MLRAPSTSADTRPQAQVLHKRSAELLYQICLEVHLWECDWLRPTFPSVSCTGLVSLSDLVASLLAGSQERTLISPCDVRPRAVALLRARAPFFGVAQLTVAAARYARTLLHPQNDPQMTPTCTLWQTSHPNLGTKLDTVVSCRLYIARSCNARPRTVAKRPNSMPHERCRATLFFFNAVQSLVKADLYRLGSGVDHQC